MEGRWTIWMTAKCDRDCIMKCADAGDLPRHATPVVPCDEAAVERVALALMNTEYSTDSYKARAERLLRAAGETP